MRFGTWHDRVFEDLDRGIIDLVFFGITPPDSLRSEQVVEEHFVCLLAAEHPLAAGKQITLDDYLQCSHLVVEVMNGINTVIDQHLQALGAPRKASLSVPFHSVAPLTVPGTNLVATVPARLAARHAGDPGLAIVPAPAEIESMRYRMVWHPRLDDDPAQRWLRNTVRAVTAEL